MIDNKNKQLLASSLLARHEYPRQSDEYPYASANSESCSRTNGTQDSPPGECTNEQSRRGNEFVVARLYHFPYIEQLGVRHQFHPHRC